MPVQTTMADTGDLCLVRMSPDCELWTRHWWGDGCVAVCQPCAALEQVTDASMRELAARDGWGPVPEHDTTLQRA